MQSMRNNLSSQGNNGSKYVQNPALVSSLDGLRLRLAQQTSTLTKLRDELTRINNPNVPMNSRGHGNSGSRYYNLNAQAAVLVAQLASTTNAAQHLQAQSVVYPSSLWPQSQNQLLTTLLRTKRTPEAESCVKKAFEAGIIEENTIDSKENDKWAIECISSAKTRIMEDEDNAFVVSSNNNKVNNSMKKCSVEPEDALQWIYGHE